MKEKKKFIRVFFFYNKKIINYKLQHIDSKRTY